jgi:hypothetical protein
MSNEVHTSWDDESVVAPTGQRGSIRRFRLAVPNGQDRTTKTGGTERIAILEASPIKVSQHYFDNRKGAATKGYFRCCAAKYGRCPACEEFARNGKDGKSSEAKLRFACNIWVYDTDANGRLVMGPSGEVAGEVFLFQFADTVFVQLREVAKAWGDLRKHDFVVTADGDLQFQQMNITIQPNSAFLTAPNAKALLEQYKADMYDVEAIVAKDYTPEELTAKLYGVPDAQGYRAPSTPAEAARAAMNVPAEDLMRELGEGLEASPAVAQPAVQESAAPKVAAPQSAAAAEGFMDLDDLMGQLGKPV